MKIWRTTKLVILGLALTLFLAPAASAQFVAHGSLIRLLPPMASPRR